MSLHQRVETRVQSDPQPAVPVRQGGVIQVVSPEDSLGEVDGGALVSAVALQQRHHQDVSADHLSPEKTKRKSHKHQKLLFMVENGGKQRA